MTGLIENLSVETTKIVCIGDKSSPHPRVYLAMGARGSVDCPYCGKRYVLKERASEDALSAGANFSQGSTMEQRQRFSSSAGIAIGPILFAVAMLAVLAMAVASGSSDFQTTGTIDRISADITAQANLIRNTINNCNMQYTMAVSMGATSTVISDPPGPYPSSNVNGTAVANLLCDPMGTSQLWNDRVNNLLLPPPTKGFNPWTYVNAGTAGGRCIWTTPATSNPSGSQGIVGGLSRVAAKFNSSATVDTTHEVVYNPSSTSQKFVVWVTMPSSAGAADSHCIP